MGQGGEIEYIIYTQRDRGTERGKQETEGETARVHHIHPERGKHETKRKDTDRKVQHSERNKGHHVHPER